MALFPSRAATTGFSPRAAWQPRVGTYPGDPAGGPTLLDMLARPMPPEMQPFMPGPPQAPAPQAPPLTAGSVPFEAEGSPGPAGVEANNWGVDAGWDLAMTPADFAFGPGMMMAGFPTSAFGLLAGMVYDNERGKTLGTTTNVTDIALQALNLPRTRDMLTDVFAPPTQVAQAQTPGTAFDVTVDPMTGQGVVSDPSLSDAVLGAPAMNAGLIGGHTAGSWSEIGGAPGQFGDMGGGGDGGGAFGGASAGSPGGGGGGFGGEEGTSSVWMTGGYTGGGADGMVQPHMPAGTVHEGEGILNAAAMRHYGDAGRKAVAAINARSVPKNRLAALVRG